MLTIRQVYGFIDERAPFETQLSFDNSGLLLGSMDREVSGVHFALDVTERVIFVRSRLSMITMPRLHKDFMRKTVLLREKGSTSPKRSFMQSTSSSHPLHT